MTESISLNEYINEKYDLNRLEKAVVGFQCSPEASNEMSCKVTFGDNLSFTSYIRNNEYDIISAGYHSWQWQLINSIRSIDCEADSDNSLKCNLEEPISDKYRSFVNQDNFIFVSNDNMKLDDDMKTLTERSISKIDCSGEDDEDWYFLLERSFQCSISLGDPIIDMDNYVANLTDKAVTNVECTKGTDKMQEATCSIYFT